MVKKPVISDCPMYQLLREEKIEEFNERKAANESFDLRGHDFRGLDLRGMDVSGIDFTNAYFRMTDLRGLDFRGCCLEGASLIGANVSGCYFPVEISANELLLALTHGTRVRDPRGCGSCE